MIYRTWKQLLLQGRRLDKGTTESGGQPGSAGIPRPSQNISIFYHVVTSWRQAVRFLAFGSLDLKFCSVFCWLHVFLRSASQDFESFQMLTWKRSVAAFHFSIQPKVP